MKRRRYLQYNKLFATPLIAPDDFEQNLSKYSDVNIVSEFDNIQYQNKKYIYSVSNNIPAYWNTNTGKENPYKKEHTHRLPDTDGIAIVHEMIGDESYKKTYTLVKGNRQEHLFNSTSTHRYVCICQNTPDGYIPMDTIWFFLGNATSVARPEWYNGYTENGELKERYNTINYCHVRADITEIPDDFMYYCLGLKGGFNCPDSVKKIGKNAFRETRINDYKIRRTNKLEEIGDYAFYNYYNNIPGEDWSKDVRIELPDTLTKIGNQAFGGNQSITVQVLRIPPLVKLYSSMFYTNGNWKCNKLIISGVGYKNVISDTNTGWYSIFLYLGSVEIDSITYTEDKSDIENGILKYGECANQVKINGKYYQNNYWVGEDRGLHCLNRDDSKNILVVKPLNIKSTEYSLKIDDGTQILDTHAFPNGFNGDNTKLVFPESLEIIKPTALSYVSNLQCADPFNPATNGGIEYNNLIELNISNYRFKPDGDGLFYIPKNVNKLDMSIGDTLPNNGIPVKGLYYHRGFKTESGGYFTDYDGILYKKIIDSNYFEVAASPKSWLGKLNSDGETYDGVLHIKPDCKQIIQKLNTMYGVKEVIFEQPDDLLCVVQGSFRNCINIKNIDFCKKIDCSNWVFSQGAMNGLKVDLPMTVNNDVPFYWNYFGYYDNKYYENETDYTQRVRFAEDGHMMRVNKNTNKKYLLCIPGYYTGYYYSNNQNNKKCVYIREGVNYFDTLSRVNPSGNNYALLSSASNSFNLILPSTIERIGSIGYSNEYKFPEIHIYNSENFPVLWPRASSVDPDQLIIQNTQLKVNTNSRPYRICRVPIDAVGHDGITKTIDKSYIYDGCWCNPICVTAKQTSELRFDLVKVSGQVTYNGNPVVNQEIIFTQTGTELKGLSEDAYMYSHLDKITVTTDDTGHYELWMKNLDYNVTYNDEVKDFPQPIQGNFVPKTIKNDKNETTQIIALEGVIDTHEKVTAISF